MLKRNSSITKFIFRYKLSDATTKSSEREASSAVVTVPGVEH